MGTAAFDAGPLGTWIQGGPLVVSRPLIDAYAEAVDAPAGGLAAPLFSVVACYPVLFRAVNAVTPPSLHGAAVHGEHDVTVHRLVRPADVLTARARPTGFEATRAGTAVHVEILVTDLAAEPVATHWLTAIVRGATSIHRAGRIPARWIPRGSGEDRIVELPVKIDADQPSRYAEVTGDRNAVHIDPAGRPGRGVRRRDRPWPGRTRPGGVGPGGCLLPGSASRLARIRARFSAPVPPGQMLAITAAEHGDGVAFGARTAAGSPALRNGWAVFR